MSRQARSGRDPAGSEAGRLLVTGTGRCGTHTVAKALTDAGLPCGHEDAVIVAGVRAAGWQAESSWFGTLHLPVPDCWTVLLVRHPAKTVASLAQLRRQVNRNEGFADNDPGGLRARWSPANWSLEMRLAAFWVGCNREAAVHADEIVRIEDLDVDILTGWSRKVGGPDVTVMPAPQHVHNPPPVEWDHLTKAVGFESAARRFGYQP